MSIFHSKAGRRGAVLLAAAVVTTLGLAGCAGTTEEATPGTGETADFGVLNLQLSWIKNEEFSGEFFADSKGYYTDAGFSKVTLTSGPSTGTGELLSGTADVALSDAISVGTVVANEEAPLKIIGSTFQKNPFTILSLADAGNILTPADLVGKKIGVQDSNASLFSALLKANGIDPASVTVVPVQYDPSVLVNGDVDGFMAYLTNESITVEQQGYTVSNLPFADNGLPFVAETITTTDDYIANNREKLKAFLVAEIKGWTDAVNDPEAGAELAISDYCDVDFCPSIDASKLGAVAQASLLVVSDDTVANGLFTITDALQAETVASLAAAGLTVSASDLFDLSLLTEVYAENPDLVAYAK
jgi:ABC-type nitrate/sulfonate/bicarbonate transport system substrate-binding protein